MAEEVRDPERTIPQAIPIALTITLAIYLVVGMAALLTTGPDRLANSAAPLTEAVNVAGAGWLAPVVRVGAAVASLGAMPPRSPSRPISDAGHAPCTCWASAAARH